MTYMFFSVVIKIIDIKKNHKLFWMWKAFLPTDLLKILGFAFFHQYDAIY